MTRHYFGTDGIRGTANTPPMTAGIVLNVAMAAAHVMRSQTGKAMNRVIIGKDTRLSGYMLEQAMASGFVAMGMDVIRTGPIPTPAVARLTTTLRADIGVMISASHNLYQDNGIKLFGSDGYKLSDDLEHKIEQAMAENIEATLPEPDQIGKATQLDDAPGRYVEYIKRSFPRGKTLSGLKVVIDCANGAAYKVAPQILWELEADVISIGDKPNGRNINDSFGATATKEIQKRVVEENADIGLALDGDADRLIVIDEKGHSVDGDQLMGLLALSKKKQGLLAHDTLVTTVMSNLGLERFCRSEGISMERTHVGDRYVVEKMREGAFNLGGEQSGHIVLGDYATTGDGLLAALQVLAVLREEERKASEICHIFDPVPQILKNVRYSGSMPLETRPVQEAIAEAERNLANDGRLLVRPSGTEPLIRVMAEGEDLDKVHQIVDGLCAVIEKQA